MLRLTLLSRLLVFFVVSVAHRVLPLFDASPRLTSQAGWLQPFVRWDTLHFQAIAEKGYTYESQWAFFPGTPFLLRLLRFGASNSFLWPLLLLAIASDSTRTLYRLTRHHFPASPSLAYLVCLLSLLPSSPATLYFAPCGEPFFTYLSYKANEFWLLATICFTLASTFRSNGIILSGYLLWGLIVQPFLNRQKLSPVRISYSILLTACVVSPFVCHNYSAYRLFCRTGAPRPDWCHRVPPSVYAHAQSEYWNVGFLRYWEPAQIPNFIIAAPPLTLLVTFSTKHLLRGFIPSLHARFAFSNAAPPSRVRVNPFVALSITPHLIHTLVMCTTLLFFSHVQIVLRLAAALPTLYWGAAWLVLDETESGRGIRWRWGKVWIWWSTVWGLISLGLWAAFLPPA